MQMIANAPIQCITRTIGGWAGGGWAGLGFARTLAELSMAVVPWRFACVKMAPPRVSLHRRREPVLADSDLVRRGLATDFGGLDENMRAHLHGRAVGRLESHDRCGGGHQNRLFAALVGDGDALGSALLGRSLDVAVRHRGVDIGLRA